MDEKEFWQEIIRHAMGIVEAIKKFKLDKK